MDGNLLTFLQHNRNLCYTHFLSVLRKEIYKPLSSLSVEVLKSKEPIPFENATARPFSPIQKGEAWGGFFDCAWFRCKGTVPQNVDLKSVVLKLDVGGEGCVYTEAAGAVQGITNVLGMVDFFQSARGKQIVPLLKLLEGNETEFTFYIDCGNNGKMGKDNGNALFKAAEICLLDREVLELYYDFLAGYQLLSALHDHEKAAEVKSILKSGMTAYKSAKTDKVSASKAALSPLFDGKGKEDFTVYAVGHGHLDLAWLWPVRETKRKAIRTFSNALYEAEEEPSYVFNGSQPQQYAFIQENAPELFARIQTAAAKGNIEPQGGMWVEPDTNLPCGESLIRQCMYGKAYFKKYFGKDVKTLWLPDVFGYTAALPQIIKKCGMENFMTIKLSWNNINQFPHHTFRWTGLGDSEVLVHMPPEGDYNSNATPYAVQKTYNQYKEKAVSDIALLSYGIGDGGAGPGEYHVHMAKRCETLRYIPKVKLSSSDAFFDALWQHKDAYPKYKGELYLEKHQGTYTTQAKVKKNNRRSEALLHFAEWVCAMASLRGMTYPKEALDRIWKEVLLYQFHDILPGSSIQRVYEECNARYAILQTELEALINDALSYLQKGKSDRLFAVNPTDFEQKGYLKQNGTWYRYEVSPYAAAELQVAEAPTEFHFDQGHMENSRLRLTFNEKGQITALFDKENQYNCVEKVMNAMRIYKDRFVHPYNAWDIDINYTKHAPTDMKLESADTFTDGHVLIREQKFSYHHSTLTQRILLEEGADFVKIENEVSWHETHKMLRADFYPKNFSDKVLCDIQFGNIERSTKTETKTDFAQFEIPAHKWVDVYKDGYGFALLNDCKYGHRVKDGLISLNCLRSPVYPDKTADRGDHKFTFCLYPHKEKALKSRLVALGYALNNPVKIVSGDIDLPQILHTDKKNIILETVFVNEKGNLALRLYENRGQQTEANFSLPLDYKEILETDMRFISGKEIKGNTLDFAPFEIKTLEVLR